MIRRGTIIAIKLDEETPTAKVMYVDALELTAKLCGKNQLIVLRNWVQATVQGRLIQKQPAEIAVSPKTIVFTEMLHGVPSRFTRLIGRLSGYQYKQHHRAMCMQKDKCGDPRMVRRWCRRKKLTGILYRDGFFIAYSGFPVYLDHFNQLKGTIWSKK
jgi:hypothetical protein